MYEATRQRIGEIIGEASMCWSETPKGVFNSERAAELVDEIMTHIQYPLEHPDDKKNNPMNQSISEEFRKKFAAPKWAPEKMQDIFNELMFGKDGVLDFWESKISQALTAERKELREQGENARRLLLEVKAHEKRYSHVIKRIQGLKEENDNINKRDTTGMIWYRRACDDILHLLENEPL